MIQNYLVPNLRHSLNKFRPSPNSARRSRLTRHLQNTLSNDTANNIHQPVHVRTNFTTTRINDTFKLFLPLDRHRDGHMVLLKISRICYRQTVVGHQHLCHNGSRMQCNPITMKQQCLKQTSPVIKFQWLVALREQGVPV